MVDSEIWKDVLGYEGRYKVSNTGKIYSKYYKRLLIGNIDLNGYQYHTLTDDEKKCKSVKTHRIVAINFIPNSDDKATVNHIDENKLNNHVDNLEWSTVKEQINHGTRTKRMLETRKTSEKYLKSREQARTKLFVPVVGVNVKDGSILKFDSIKQAKEYGFTGSSITGCIRGIRHLKTHKGYEWYTKEQWEDHTYGN